MSSNFHGFIGMAKKVAFLTQQLHGAQARNEPAPHLLMIGESGMGKTCLARALAQEFGTNMHVLHGKTEPKDICAKLVEMKRSDFFFLDECHSLPKDSQELLFKVMDKDGWVPDHLGSNWQPPPGVIVDRNPDGTLKIEDVTVVLATNLPSKLLDALKKRVNHEVQFQAYPTEALLAIATETATKNGMLFEAKALKAVAKASAGTPRKVISHLNSIARHFPTMITNRQKFEVAHVKEYLKAAELMSNGLTDVQRKYMEYLADVGNASLHTLACEIPCDSEHVKNEIEPALKHLRFLRMNQTGRFLTPAGIEQVRKWRQQNQSEANVQVVDAQIHRTSSDVDKAESA
jgi:Holliday junction resolvasome RuvABC ATP-dependent DNA helicase subunit